jgi:hypothetical protein
MDLAAGVVVGGIAVQAARSVRDPSQWPLAAIPAVLAVHQLIEAAVWWGAEGRLPSDVGQAATLAYLGIAFVVVPVLVPAAVTMLEPPPRRAVMKLMVLLGVVSALVLGWSLATQPFTARVERFHLAYPGHVVGGAGVVALYVVGTCGALLLSSRRALRWWGVLNVPAIVLLAWLQQSAFISLWCVWAALSSVAVLIYLRRMSDPKAPGAADERVPGEPAGHRG